MSFLRVFQARAHRYVLGMILAASFLAPYWAFAGLVLLPSGQDASSVDPTLYAHATVCDRAPTFETRADGREELVWPTTGCFGISYLKNDPNDIAEFQELYDVGGCFELTLFGLKPTASDPGVLESCYYVEVPTSKEPAVSRGLVPCGGTGQEPCQACHVIDLTNNVIGWLVIILGTIAAIIIVYAGAKLVTANGNQRAMEDAKSMINNMIIGYVIVLAGWLLVDTVLKAVLNEGQYGVWNQVQCVVQPVALLNEYEPWEGGVLTTNCTPLPNGSWNCGQQNTSCAAGGGIPADDPMTPSVFECDYPGGTGARPPDLSAGGACDAGLISPYFGNLTGSAQCIIEAESACGASMVSRTDVMSHDGRAFSFGPMQINLTVHVLEGCSGYPPVMRCLDAFSGRNYDARVINEELYQQCARAAQDMNCNIKNGARIYAEAGNSWSPWSTAAGCGLY